MEPELLDKQIQIYPTKTTAPTSPLREEAVDTDLIKGTLTEWGRGCGEGGMAASLKTRY